jgi:chromosome segregation ATPase
MHDFTDLRVDQISSKGDDSFWPSFTDIMTVIVMIFLIATSMLILQNWKLIAEITSTLEAKKEVQELVQFTSKENQSLEEQLIQAESQLSLLRFKMSQADNKRAELISDKEKQLQKINQLTKESEQVSLELTKKEQLYTLLNNQLLTNEQKNALLATKLETSQKRNLTLEEENLKKAAIINQQEINLIEQNTLLSTKDIEISSLQRFKAQNNEKLDSLNTQFKVLKVKYDKLVKPARSSKGKVVIEVIYNKVNKILKADLKLPNVKTFKNLSDKVLHKKLTQLKKQHGKKLYIRIIFPKDSGLSYDEAWKFTNDILQKYDYYY